MLSRIPASGLLVKPNFPIGQPWLRPRQQTIRESASSEYPSAAQPSVQHLQPVEAGPGTPSSNGVYPAAASSPGFLQKVKEYFVGSKEEKNKLASLGMGAFASYGVISNITYGVCLTVSWIAFIKATGTTPLQPGQWKPFLAFYAGLWTIQNFVRPMRFALAVALAPAFDRFITGLGEWLRIPKPAAFGLFLTCMAMMTTACLGSAIWALGGFPDGIPFFSQTAASA